MTAKHVNIPDGFVSTTEASRLTGPSRVSWWRACATHPGLAVRFGRNFYIPLAHIDRVKAGDTVAQIAADARAKAEGRS